MQIQNRAFLLLLSWSQNNLSLLGKDPRNLSNLALLEVSCVGAVWFGFFSGVLVQTLKGKSRNVFVEGYVVWKTGCTF